MKDAEIFGKDTNETYKNIRVSIDGNPLVAGNVANDAVDSGNPVKVGGIARQTNPTPVANADRVNASYDDLGRQVMTLYQVRDLIATGSANLVLAQETAVISGVASTLLDVVHISGANTSGVAIRVDLRYGTGGAVIDSLVIPAMGVAEKNYTIPIPMSEVAQAITARVNQAGEISDSPITITAIAIQNV